MSVCRSEVEFGGTVYKSVPDVAPTWENAVLRGGFPDDAGVEGTGRRRRAGF